MKWPKLLHLIIKNTTLDLCVPAKRGFFLKKNWNKGSIFYCIPSTHQLLFKKNPTIDARTELVYIRSNIWNIAVINSIRMKSPFMFVTNIKIGNW